MCQTQRKWRQSCRPVVLAVVLALTVIPAAFAVAPSAARISAVWRRIESAAPARKQPLANVVAAAATGGRRRAVLAPGACSAGVVASIVEVGDLAIDDQYIYFVDGSDTIARVSKAGATPTLLGEVPGIPIVAMAIDDARIYFATLDDSSFVGTIHSMAKNGGPIKTLVSGIATPFDLAVDGQFVYWAAVGTSTDDDFLGDGSIGRANKGDGSDVINLASNLSTPLFLTVDATHVYFSEVGSGRGNPSAGLRRVSLTGGTVLKLVDGVPVGPMAVDSSAVYFSSVNSGESLDISSMPKSGGTPRLLLTNLEDTETLKVWASTLYFTGTIGDVLNLSAIPVAGGTTRLVKSELYSSEFGLEECLAYFATEHSTLERAPR
jgi:hypothetical protein